MTNEEAAISLAGHREQIDRIDVQLLALLNERTRIVEHIGAIKAKCALPVYEPRREDAVYRNVLEHNQGPLPSDAVRRIFERIIDEMRTLQSLRNRK
ncbi:MAG: chorismate mutase [Bryobacteraceae bacterium]|nr:chorismate mutase [Bryobacteraceae bacterium]